MDDVESLCRILCKAQGVDPDVIIKGRGYLGALGIDYPLWQTRRIQAWAILEAGWKPPTKRKRKNVTN